MTNPDGFYTTPAPPRNPRSFWSGVAVSVLAGLLIALSMPPWGFWPLAMLGIGMADFLLADPKLRTRFTRGSFMGAAWLFPSLIWIWDFSPLGYITAGVGFSLFYGVAGIACPPGGKLRWLALPSALTLTEFLRWNWPFGGVPLSTLAMSQSDSPLLDTASIFGSLLLVWLAALGGIGMAALIRRDWMLSVAIAVLLSVAISLAPLAPSSRVSDTIKVALVQGGGPQRTRAVDTNFNEVFNRHLQASADFIDTPVDLVIWPENVVDIEGQLSGESPQVRRLADLAEMLNAPILAGVIEDAASSDATGSETTNTGTTNTGTTSRFNNFSIVITPERTLGDRYDKVQRVPFGEYVPLRWLVEPFAPDFLPSREANPGSGPAVVEIDIGRAGQPGQTGQGRQTRQPGDAIQKTTFGVVISWEIFFDHRARDAVNNGGQIIINPTNGSSYWLTIVQSQQVASSRLRAVETGRFVLQTAPTGFTAVVSPDGEVLQRSKVSEQIVLLADVELRVGRTLAVRLGSWPMLGIATAGLAAAWLSFRRLRRQK